LLQLAKRELQLVTKPVLLGPVTFLHFSDVVAVSGTSAGGQAGHCARNLALLPALLPEYVKVIRALVDEG
jgi:hypothetical protein